MIPQDLKHFRAAEFKAPSAAVDSRLCYGLDALREDVGGPVVIHCTFDTNGHEPASRHKLSPCDAADLHVVGVPPATVLRAILAGGWGGVGWYPHWNHPGWHLDLRPGTRKYWVRTKDGYVYGLPVLLKAVGLTLEDVENAGPCPSDAFRLAHAFTAKAEGGLTRDAGGATNHGVSFRLLRQLSPELGDIDHDGDVDEDDIRALTPEDAQRLMKLLFWDGLKLDALAPITACSVYDFAVNAGPSQAVKALQQSCRYYPHVELLLDGVLGPKTRATVNGIATNPARDMILAQRVTRQRRNFYASLHKADPRQPLAGWLNRCDALDSYCLKLAGRAAPAAEAA